MKGLEIFFKTIPITQNVKNVPSVPNRRDGSHMVKFLDTIRGLTTINQ